jgi:hypothetical protein
MKIIARTFSIIAVTLAMFLPGFAQQGAAAPTVYHVEIVIFRSLSGTGAESWSAQAGRDFATASDERISSDQQVGRFVQILPPGAYRLNDVVSKLRASSAYQPLAHVAWAQTASAWGTRAGFSLQRLGINTAGLSGSVVLERGQYLHLSMALQYAPGDPPAGLAAGPGTVFNLQESRRVRFYEQNYYDHPAFGVIALVTPAQGARGSGR